jgi:uncharacterized protein YbjQ (UPF0145 family)
MGIWGWYKEYVRGVSGRNIDVMQGEPYQAYKRVGLVHGRGLSNGQCELSLRGKAARKKADAVINVQYSHASNGVHAHGTAIKYL